MLTLKYFVLFVGAREEKHITQCVNVIHLQRVNRNIIEIEFLYKSDVLAFLGYTLCLLLYCTVAIRIRWMYEHQWTKYKMIIIVIFFLFSLSLFSSFLLLNKKSSFYGCSMYAFDGVNIAFNGIFQYHVLYCFH